MGIISSVKTLFGSGKPTTSRQGVAQITPDHVPDGALASLWELHDGRMPETPKRIQDTIDFLTGKKRAPIPAEFPVEERDAMRGDSQTKYRRVLQECARLSAKVPRTKRPKAGESNAAKRQSSKIEGFAEAVLQKKYAYRSSVKTLKIEGELFLFSYPAPSHWKYIPSLFDEDEEEGEHIGQDDFDALPEPRQREYEGYDRTAPVPTDPEADEDAAMLLAAQGEARPGATDPETTTERRYKRRMARFRVNTDGEPDDGSDAFEIDLEESNKLYSEEMGLAYGQNIPLEHEFVHRQDCIPINPRREGDKIAVDGVLRRSLFSRSELIARRYRYFDMDEQLEPVSARDGKDGDFWLYEYRTKDARGKPFIVWQVGERSTTRDGEAVVVNLWDEYRISDMLVHYDVGESWDFANWDLNSITATQHVMQDSLNRDAIVTGLTMSTWVSGWPTFGQKMTTEGMALAKLYGDADLNYTMRPNQIVPLWGELVELTSKGSNVDVKALFQILGEELDKLAASPGAFGGEGPVSGLDRQITGRDFEIANSPVTEAARRMYEAAARHTLIICTALARKAGRPVEVWAMNDETPPQTGKQTTSYTVYKLGPDDIGPNPDVIAEFPNVPGENMAATTVWADMEARGLLLREEWRTLYGDPQPELFEAKRQLQMFYDSPAGQLDLMQGLADYLADERMRKLIALTNKGQMTGAQGGAPTSVMNGLLGGGGGGAAAGVQNPGQQAAAGALGGVMQADAASAGGTMDGMGGADLGMAA